MITDEVYINGKLMDLSNNTRIGRTYQSNNIGELQNRQGDYTNQVKFPKTRNNRIVLESMDYVNSATLIPYRINTAQILQEGIDTMQEAIVTAISSDEKEYTVQFTSGNTNFFSLFPDVKISQLNIPGMEHTNDFGTIVASRESTSGVIYPLIDWFNPSTDNAFTDNKIRADYLMPCIRVKDVFEAMDQLTGYTSAGSFIESQLYQNLIITPSRLERSDEAKTKYNQVATNDVDLVYPIGTYPDYTFLDFNQTGYGFTSNSYIADDGIYGYMTFRGAIYWTNNTGATQSPFFRIQLFRTNTSTLVDEVVVGLGLLDGDTGEFLFDLVSSNITFSSADTYQIRVLPVGSFFDGTNFTLSKESKWKFNLVDNMPYGSLLNATELYEIKVKEIYQDVMNKFGVLSQTNSFRREVYFNFFEDIQANMTKARDWSKKADPNKCSINYKFGSFGKTNNFLHEPDDYTLPGTGDSFFTIDDETLPDFKDVVKLKTSAANEETRFQNETFPRIEVMNETPRTFQQTNFRILLLDVRDTPYVFEYMDNLGNSFETQTSIPFVKASPLYFENLLPVYYPTLESILRRTKGIKIPINLTPKDIQELDYLIPIYLNVHTSKVEASGYFYLNKIENYQRGFTSCELMRL